MAYTLAILSLLLLVAACGGESSAPTSATPVATTSPDPRVLSCSQVSYRGATESFTCSIPGQQQQPTAIHKFFPGRSDCLIVSCSAGCVSSVRVGTNTNNSCR